MYIVCMCVCAHMRICVCVCVCVTERQSGLWHISSVLSDEKVLVGEGAAERRGVQLREEGAVGLPAKTREVCVGEGGELSGEAAGGAKMLNTVGALTRSAVQAAVSGRLTRL